MTRFLKPSSRRELAVASAALAAAAFGVALPAQADSAWGVGYLSQSEACEQYALPLTNHASRGSCLAREARAGESDAYAQRTELRSEPAVQRTDYRAEDHRYDMIRAQAGDETAPYTTTQARERNAIPGAQPGVQPDPQRDAQADQAAQDGDWNADERAADQAGRPNSPDAAPAAQSEARNDADMSDYTVKEGDTLWSIAEAELGEGERYPMIVEANEEAIDDPDVIVAGQTLRLPSDAG